MRYNNNSNNNLNMQKIFGMVISLKIPFIPTNPFLAAMSFFFFVYVLFFPFFFLNVECASSPKPQNIEI